MRAKVGDAVLLFDGSGSEFRAVIQAVGRSETQLHVQERQELSRELPHQLTLAIALPKGERQQWLVEKLVELGVTRIIPLKTDFGVAQPGEKATQRIKRWVIAASKQCGRNELMHFEAPVSSTEFLNTKHQGTVLISHPYESLSLQQLSQESPGFTAQAVTLAIGPEGGFSDGEIELAKSQHYPLVSLGPRILRIETAAVAMASAIIYAYTP